MTTANATPNGTAQHWIVARQEPSGEFTAQVIGQQELRATAATRAEAIEQIRARLSDWIASGQLIAIDVPCPNPLLHFTGHIDPNDPLEQEFMAELARLRREDLEQTLREDDQECPNSSSTPTT